MKKRNVGLFCSLVDQGRVRISNEDQAMVKVNSLGDVLLCVCDGMGGQNKGDFASKAAIDFLFDAFLEKKRTSVFFSKVWLRKTISKANNLIFGDAETKPQYKNMGTTLVAVLLLGDKLIIANVGDSRAYSYSKAGLRCLTEDQTYVEYLYRTGRISQSETKSREDRHVLMNALGIYPSVSVDISVRPYFGESILLCSDGLYNNISEAEIRAILSTDERPEDKARLLVQEANSNGGSDNIAIAYWEKSND